MSSSAIHMGYTITLVDGRWVIVGTDYDFSSLVDAQEFLDEAGYPAGPAASFLAAGFAVMAAR